MDFFKYVVPVRFAGSDALTHDDISYEILRLVEVCITSGTTVRPSMTANFDTH